MGRRRIRPSSAAAWGLWLLFAAGTGLAIFVRLASGAAVDLTNDVPFIAVFTAFATVGAFVASRRPRNPIGWIFLAAGMLTAVGALGETYTDRAVPVRGPVPALAVLATWTQAWFWYPLLSLGTLFTLLLFPSGLPSRRWRPVLWVCVLAVAAVTVMAALTPSLDLDGRTIDNPIGVDFAGTTGTDIIEESLLFQVFGLVFVAGIVASVASLVVRFRRSRGEERLQLKWFVSAAILVALTLIPSILIPGYGDTTASTILFALAIGFLPVSCGIAILKHRLYDIDVVISRTVVYGALAAFITAVYVAIVVGVGSAVGGGDEPNLALSIVATAVVAVAFQPVRERVQRLANRLVYGRRAAPYEALAGLSERLAGTYATDDVLARMARIITEATGAARAEVWLRVGSELVRAARWPADGAGTNGDGSAGPPPDRVPLAADGVLEIGGARAEPVTHRGELLGALAVVTPPGESLSPTEEKVLSDLAAQAGLVLRNARLTAELRARLDEISARAEELRSSRQRIVAAQDAERRRLERNIHDGAQQHLVALAVKLNLTRTMAPKDAAGARKMLGEVRSIAAESLETLRDLARGVYPKILSERGLAEALEAQGAGATVPVEVTAEAIGRYPEEVEAAIYFSCLEALQNAAKHSAASRIAVRLADEGGVLRFTVQDDGAGFDPSGTPAGLGLQSMADRMNALGGDIEVRSAPGEGTIVTGRIPALTAEAVAG